VGEVYEHGPLLKKWFVNNTAILDHESQDLAASLMLWKIDDDRVWPVSPHYRIISVPYKEFRELVFMLPDFTELPILWTSWCSLDRPVKFIVRCIDDNDTIFIDTSGFHYARYRAACRFKKVMV
jgi:hypothetical protein